MDCWQSQRGDATRSSTCTGDTTWRHLHCCRVVDSSRVYISAHAQNFNTPLVYTALERFNEIQLRTRAYYTTGYPHRNVTLYDDVTSRLFAAMFSGTSVDVTRQSPPVVR